MHEQVELFNKTFLNIFHNFIPNKIILCDDKDPPWMNGKIKNLIKRKNWISMSEKVLPFTKVVKIMVILLNVRILNIIIHKHLLKENNYNNQAIEIRSGLYYT